MREQLRKQANRTSSSNESIAARVGAGDEETHAAADQSGAASPKRPTASTGLREEEGRRV